MANYGQHYAKRAPTPQSQPIPEREKEQVQNSAGGFVFDVGNWAMLDRFLILGSEGGSYYAGERELTIKNAKCVEACLKEDGPRTVARIVDISVNGRAPKNDPALFALALCASAVDDVATRRAALAALPLVARIGTHLFQFAGYVQAQRGWGRALRRAIGDWYNLQPVDKLAYSAVKYQQREGWSNRDLLRLSHPVATDESRRAIYDWMCGRKTALEMGAADILTAYDHLKANPAAGAAVDMIARYNMPREAIPTELLKDVDVWKALLAKMPLHAMVRNLGKMTSIKVLDALQPDSAARVVEKLGSVDAIRNARMHPLSLLIALKTYAQGHGDKGSLSWSPVPAVIDALDGSFYHAFQAVEPTNKRTMMALDVSGSMASGRVAGSSLTPREASAAMALVTAATEKAYVCVGFTSAGHSRRQFGGRWGSGEAGLTPLPITAKQRLDDVVQMVSNLPFGGTDCALPMLFALEQGLLIDAFVIYTDSETWAGSIHPTQALKMYREKTGINAKLIVVGMVSNGFTIADPKDPGMLDVVGFDTATPAVIADFIRG